MRSYRIRTIRSIWTDRHSPGRHQWVGQLDGTDDLAYLDARNLADLDAAVRAFVFERYAERDPNVRVGTWIEVADGRRAPNGFARFASHRAYNLGTGACTIWDYAARRDVDAA